MVVAFQMVHRAGLLACRTHRERLALLWLCEQADLRGWSRPFDCRNTDIAEATGSPKGWVAHFIRRMAEVDVLTVVHPGTRRTPRRVMVHRPGRITEYQVGVPGRDPNCVDGNPNNRSGESQNTKLASQVVVDLEIENENETETENPRADVQAVWDANRKHHPRRGKKPPASDAKHIRARLAESDLDACLLVAEWAHSPGSWWLANDRLGIGTLYKADKWSDRLEQAETWAAGGRTGKAPAAPSTDLLAFLYARRSGCPAEKFKADTAAEGLDPAALMAALDAVGFSSRADLNRLPSARWAFVSRDLRAAYDRLVAT